MQMNAVAVATPYYVLMDGTHRLGPVVARPPAGSACSLIYGFSDKVLYDHFQNESQLPLTPYPLVKGYLREQIGAPHACLKLVVLDAAGPGELSLQAATMQAVLEAQENQAANVTATHQLNFDQETSVYRLEEVTN